MDRVIAVTGVTGRLGGLVARGLAAAGVPTRLVARDPARLPDLPGAEPAPAATYADAAAMRRALTGADTLFLVSAHEATDRVAEHRTAVDAALAAGVGRIVYVSFQGAAPDATFTFGRDHWHTERYIRSTGVRFTFLRDNLYLSEFGAMAGADGVIRGPAGDGRLAAVAHEDVADSAVAVLTGDGHDGASYDLTGPAAIGLAEVAAELTRVAGRPVRYVAETPAEAYASRAHYGAPDWEVAGWVTSYEAIAHGDLAGVSDAVPRLTGHPACSLADYLDGHPESYRALAAG